MHTKVVFQSAKALADIGCVVLRFNFRGVGRSAGAWDEGRGEMDDYRAARRLHGRRSIPDLEIWAAGFSFGSYIAMTVGADDDRVCALIGIAPPVDRYEFASVKLSTKPKFIIHGEHDELIPLEAGAGVLRAAAGAEGARRDRSRQSPVRRPGERSGRRARGSARRTSHARRSNRFRRRAPPSARRRTARCKHRPARRDGRGGHRAKRCGARPASSRREIDDVILGLRDAGGRAGPERRAHRQPARRRAGRGVGRHRSTASARRACRRSPSPPSASCAASRSAVVAGGTESMSLVPMGGNKVSPNPALVDSYPDVYLSTGPRGREPRARERHQPRGAGRVRAAQPSARAGRDRRRAVRRRDHAADVPRRVAGERRRRAGRPRRHVRAGRGAAARHVARGAGEAAAGVPCGRHASPPATRRRRATARRRCSSRRRRSRRSAACSRWRASSPSPRPASSRSGSASARCRRSARSLKLAGLTLDEIDLVELNEAFAAQVLACLRELPIDPERLNVNGGAIALGHPLGCTGAKLTTTLLYEMRRRNVALRPGDDVRRRRHGRGGHLRTDVDDMTTTTSTTRRRQGRLVAARGRTPRRRLHAGEAHRRAPADGADDRRVRRRPRCCRRSTRLEAKDWELARALVRRCGELGLLGISVPEEYGGLDLDKVSSLVVVERIARSASFATTFGGQANLCILPHRALRHRRRRRRSTCRGWSAGELVGAYALSESGSGSDALAAQDARDEAARRQLGAQRREDVDHQRRLRRPDHRLRQGGRRAVHRVHRRARVPRRQLRQGRAQDGPARLVDDADPAAGRARCRPTTCSARSARATRWR